MRRGLILSLLPAMALSLWNCRIGPEEDRLDRRARIWNRGLDALDSSLARLEAINRDGAPDSALQARFREARMEYKASEALWEYAFPVSSKRLNGPSVDEVEMDCDHSVIPAEGFQVLEELLYPEVRGAPDERAVLIASMRQAIATAGRAEVFEPIGTRIIHRPLAWTDSSLLDAVRQEIYRLAALGITGFDSPIAKLSLMETRASLQGMDALLSSAFTQAGDSATARALGSLRSVLQDAAAASEGDFNGFDRATFLAARIRPAYAALADFQAALGAPWPLEDRAFDPAERDMFSSTAWNPEFFGPEFSRPSRNSQAELGRLLFSDPALSGDGSRSCATCHRPDRGFSDGQRRSVALGGRKQVLRNSPTLLHAAFQQGVFWDQRAGSLEDQASMVVHNPEEMGGSLEASAAAMSGDPIYAARFQSAFAADSSQDRDMPVTPLRIRRALAAYIRSLAPFDSPWDRSMRGQEESLSREARHGFNLFMGKAKCATCHFPPLFNGTVPPLFLESDLEVLGIPAEPAPATASLDPDPGRMGVDKVPLSRGAFKTPTVRNVAFTAPYMHNGVFATLEEVVEFYDAGGGAGLGLHVPNQTLPADSLKLSGDEKRALIAFMKSLGDTAGTGAVDYVNTRNLSAGP